MVKPNLSKIKGESGDKKVEIEMPPFYAFLLLIVVAFVAIIYFLISILPNNTDLSSPKFMLSSVVVLFLLGVIGFIVLHNAKPK